MEAEIWGLGRAVGLGKREILLVVPETEGEIRDDEKERPYRTGRW